MLALREAGYVNVRGIDISEPAVALARCRGVERVEAGVERVEAMDGAALTFADESFDVVLASDVLEHIEDEGEALQSWRRVLKPWGRLIVFVPAFNPLRSEHDIPNEHFRRYTAQRLVAALWQQGFMTERAAYWNIALLAPVAVARLLRAGAPSTNAHRASACGGRSRRAASAPRPPAGRESPHHRRRELPGRDQCVRPRPKPEQ
jgi:SAM-dependent methyltransferase